MKMLNQSISKKIILTIIIIMPMIACADQKELPDKVKEKIELPFTLIVDKEISGAVFGENLTNPFGVASSSLGYLFVVDAGNHRVIRFNDQLKPDKDIGGFGNEPGLFDEPSFISVDNSLNFIVSDAGNKRLVKFDSKLNYFDETMFDDETDQLKFSYLSGSALTEYGELWLADNQNNRVAIFNNIGQFDQFIGEFGYGGGALRSPEKIIAGDNSTFIVCDAGNQRLVWYDDYGNYKNDLESDYFQYPIACALDKDNRLWIVDNNHGAIYYKDKKTDLVFKANLVIPGNTKTLKNPSDLAFLFDGRLVISDSGNNRVLICKIIDNKR